MSDQPSALERWRRGSHPDVTYCAGNNEFARDVISLMRECDDLRIENAQICEKLVSAQRGEDIPGLVQRIAKAERELELARPVIEAAEAESAHHTSGPTLARLALLRANGNVCQCALCVRIRAYDAAREEGEGK
jgi:hypothetical protein